MEYFIGLMIHVSRGNYVSQETTKLGKLCKVKKDQVVF